MLFTVFLIISLLISLALTYVVKIIAEKSAFYDIPKDELKNHTVPTPYAGAAIWLTFMLVLLALRFFTSFETGTLRQLRGIVYGGSIIFILGFIDDIFDLDYRVKFLGQILAGAALIYYDVYIKIFPGEVLNIIASLFWVILIVNAVNIIDILDGLASGVGGIAALAFFAITLPIEKLYVNFAAIILFGTLAGFWFYNKPRAKVFMGDGGSLFVGFILAALSMGADYSGVSIIGLFSPLLILAVPIYDTILVSYFRWRSNKSIFKGSKDHYAIRLTIMGFSPWQIDLISYAICILLGIAAFLITVVSPGYAFFILVVILVLGMVGSGALNTVTPHLK